MTPPDPLTVAYIAGLIDGEGCIGISRAQGTGRLARPLTVIVAVGMTRREPLDLLAKHFGSKAYPLRRNKPGNRKPAFQWRVSGRAAENLIRAIRPYLLVKAEQADLALSVRDHMKENKMSFGPAYKRDPARDAEINAFREAAKARMHELNKRGADAPQGDRS